MVLGKKIIEFFEYFDMLLGVQVNKFSTMYVVLLYKT